MPIQTFQSNDGVTLDEIVPIGTESIRRGSKLYKRVFPLAGFSYPVRSEMTPKESVWAGYRKNETKRNGRRSSFSAKQIKAAWGM